MKGLFDWIDDRTGVRKLAHAALFEHVPGGARWRYVWGSTLTFAITVQFITGIFLWMAYSASAQTAWESVYYIQEVMPGGWLLRGIHHFTAQLMVPLLVLHLMQVVIDGAYKAPREFNYWFGIGLLLLTLGLSLTGYLLPWDQKGYWATKVATNLAAGVPVVGEATQRLIVGGSDYGHHTLTRFFALHAGVLPAALVGLIVIHVYLFRRHGLTPKLPKRGPDSHFWPDQVLKDAVACCAVLATVLGMTIWFRGADLGAPANPGEQFSAARPDWYFMFLFQFLKDFPGFALQYMPPLPGGVELWGSVILPTLGLAILTFMPVWGRWKLGHAINVLLLFVGLAGFALFSWRGFAADNHDPYFRAAVAAAHRDATRAKVLAKERGGIPPEGALALLREDVVTQGPKLFAAKCASCHAYDGHNGLGAPLTEKQTAPDLKGFGTRAWLAGFMDPKQIETAKYFGGTVFVNPKSGGKKSKMVRYILEDVPEFTGEEQKQLEVVITALAAEAKHPAENLDATVVAEGVKLLNDGALKCIDCHQFHVPDDGSGPDLTGWGSREWMLDFLKNPAHDRLYGERNDRMPAFGEKGELTTRQMEMIVDWLRM